MYTYIQNPMHGYDMFALSLELETISTHIRNT